MRARTFEKKEKRLFFEYLVEFEDLGWVVYPILDVEADHLEFNGNIEEKAW